ncbi:MAG TPA: BON domain-containing protein [Longimicrobium sp.]
MTTAALHQPIARSEESASASVPGAARRLLVAQLPIRVALLAPGETDEEIAAAARRALATNPCIPCERVRVEVRDGRITLEGEVEWLYQCFDAYEAVCRVKEAAGCTNHINVVPRCVRGGQAG